MRRFLTMSIAPLALLLLVGAGCSSGDVDLDSLTDALDSDGTDALEYNQDDTTKLDSKPASVSTATAKNLYSEVESFVQESFPDAVLYAVNNYGTSISAADYTMPAADLRTTTGDSPFWVYVFMTSPSVLDDETLDGDEAVAVIFEDGELTLRGYKASDTLVLIADEVPPAVADWKVDSDEAIQKTADAVEAELGETAKFQHAFVSMENTFFGGNWEYDITLFTTADEGYSAYIHGETGEATEVGSVEFTPY